MLGGELLMDDASIRDFNGGIGCYVASALEQTLLLPKDMVELRGFRRSEVFLHTKRFLGMVCTYSPLLFFSFFLLFFLNFFIWCNTHSFLFVSRLSKIHSGSRKWPTPSISNWTMRGKGGLLLCKPWQLLKTATLTWRRNWLPRNRLEKRGLGPGGCWEISWDQMKLAREAND